MNVDMNTTRKMSLQTQLERLSSNKRRWGEMKPERRIEYLRAMLKRAQELDHRGWGNHSSTRQGYDPNAPHGETIAAAEEMVNSAIMVGTIRALIRTYTGLAERGAPPQVKSRPAQVGPQHIASVFPYDLADRMSPFGMVGVKGEVWTPDGPPIQRPTNNGHLSLVLGAGNQSFLAFGDVMHEMFVKGNVTILKHHPVRAFGAPFYEDLFRDLIEDGFFASTLGDLEISGWLCQHELVEAVHMTGGTATHDAIVWGADHEQQAHNKQANTPVLNKPMTSELGCITPWIICSGIEWTDKQLRRHAAQLTKAFVSQNSCNCLSPKVIILDDDWPQADQFIEYFRECLSIAPSPPPYYPGSQARFQGFKEAYPAEVLELIQTRPASSRTDHELGETLGWLLVHMDAESDPYAVRNEAFAPVLAIRRISGENKCDVFLPKAVAYVNEEVWGTLSCTVLIHDKLRSLHSETLEHAIADLRYGVVAINLWSSVVYGLDGCTWGAFPGEPLDNVASGIGLARNAFLIQNVEKSVLRSSFVHSGQLLIGQDGGEPLSAKQYRAVSKIALKPSFMNVVKLIWHMIMSRPK